MNGYLFIKIQRLSNWIKTQKDSLLYLRGMLLKCSRREMGEDGAKEKQGEKWGKTTRKVQETNVAERKMKQNHVENMIQGKVFGERKWPTWC